MMAAMFSLIIMIIIFFFYIKLTYKFISNRKSLHFSCWWYVIIIPWLIFETIQSWIYRWFLFFSFISHGLIIIRPNWLFLLINQSTNLSVKIIKKNKILNWLKLHSFLTNKNPLHKSINCVIHNRFTEIILDELSIFFCQII